MRFGKSGRGQPHSMTLAPVIGSQSFRQVLDCGCPPPLSAKPLITQIFLARFCASGKLKIQNVEAPPLQN
jgi:hypothetical protein